MKKISIYSLTCPIDGVVKYVGQTINNLNIRLGDHVSCKSNNIEKNLWIKHLKSQGLKPVISLIEITDEAFADFKENYWVDFYTNQGIKLYNKPPDENNRYIILNKYLSELQRLQYSKQTINSYKAYFICFLRDFAGKIYKNITADEITHYMAELVNIKKISSSHQNSLINAIKFYYEKVLGYPAKTYYIGRPRKKAKVRPILSPPQVLALVNSIKNLKHKTAIQLMYSGALRIGETTTLLAADFNFEPDQNTLHIRDPKGGDDRVVVLPLQTMNLVKIYLQQYKCDYYLFEGQNPSEPYSATSIRMVFDRHIKLLNFNPELTPHCLRHSRLSHLLNNGMKIEMASRLAGHKNIGTIHKTYHHYQTEDMKNQMDDADEKILLKSTNQKQIQ